MATSGYVYSGYIADSRFYVYWKQIAQDISGNYTTIEWTAGIENGDYWYSNALKINSIVINGSEEASNLTYSNVTTQGKVTLARGTVKVEHNDVGEGAISISINGWGYGEGTVSGSGSFALTTIPRKTEISLSASSVNFGGKITISCPKKSSSFTNKLYYKINSGDWVQINADAGNSQVFNVAMSLIEKIPNDMSCTITISCDTWSGEDYIGNSKKTFTAKVTSAAKTTPALSASSIVLRDGTVTITLDPHAATWQHVIAYSIGNSGTLYIQETKTTNKSFKFTPSINLAKQIPNATSGSITIKVYTYNGAGKLVGSTSVPLKVTVPTDIIPTISKITATEAATIVTNNFEGFVQNLSKMLIAVTSSGSQGSTIKSCKTTVSGSSYSGTKFTSKVITKYGSAVPITAIVTDSRGRSSEKVTLNVKVIKYTPPSLKIDVDVLTEKVKIRLRGAVASVDEQNTKKLVLKYKATTAETYTSETITLDAWTFDKTIERSIDASETTYEFIGSLTDKISSVTAKDLTGVVAISRRAGGKGVTFGGEATKDGFVSKWHAYFEKNATVDGILTLKQPFRFATANKTTTPIYIWDGDENGQGMAIGAGGPVVIGGGESAKNFVDNVGLTGTEEQTYITSDNYIYFYTNCNEIANKQYAMAIDTSGNVIPQAGVYLQNNKALYVKDSADNYRNAMFINSSNVLAFGYGLYEGKVGSTRIFGNDIQLFSNTEVYMNTGLYLLNDKGLYFRDTGGTYRKQAYINSSNIYALGYGLYAAELGSTRVYGNEVHFHSKNAVHSHQNFVLDNDRQVMLNDASGTARTMLWSNSSNQFGVGYGSYTGSIGSVYYDGHVVYIRSNGAVYVNGSAISTSDEREKENIIPLGMSPIMTLSLDETEPIDIHSELFDRLQPVQFNYINRTEARTCFGLIAQDVLAALEELGFAEDELDLVYGGVDTGEHTDRYGISYQNFTALLIHEVQKLKAKVMILEAERN